VTLSQPPVISAPTELGLWASEISFDRGRRQINTERQNPLRVWGCTKNCIASDSAKRNIISTRILPAIKFPRCHSRISSERLLSLRTEGNKVSIQITSPIRGNQISHISILERSSGIVLVESSIFGFHFENDCSLNIFIGNLWEISFRVKSLTVPPVRTRLDQNAAISQ
jgi:hypothetical protein